MDSRDFFTWVRAAKLRELTREVNEATRLMNALHGEPKSVIAEIERFRMEIAGLEGDREKIHRENWEDLKRKKRG